MTAYIPAVEPLAVFTLPICQTTPGWTQWIMPEQRLPRAPSGTLALAAALLLGGCISHGAFQPPRVLDAGQTLFGFGFTATRTIDRTGAGDPDNIRVSITPQVHLRIGLGEGDAAVRFAGIPPWGVLSVDLRWQLVEDPFPVTAGFGVGGYTGCRFWKVEWCEGLVAEEPGLVFLPSLMFGPEGLYGGGRGVIRMAVDSVRPDPEE